MATPNIRMRRSGVLRRGEITVFTAVALASLAVTVYSTAKGARDQRNAELAAEELRTRSVEIADQSRKLMELKVQRMHERGDLTQAEYELAVTKINAPRNRKVFSDMVSDLQRQQHELAEQGFYVFMVNALVNVGFAEAGNFISTGATFAEREIIQEGLRNYLNAANDLASVTLTAGQEELGAGHSSILTPEQFLQAMANAEQRLEGGGEDSEMRTNVRARVRAFFDKWHSANVQTVTKKYFEENRESLKNKCHADFEHFIGGELAEQGWTVQPEGLEAFAWACLKNYLFYRRTFPADDQLYQLEWIEPRKKPLRTKEGDSLLLKRELRVDDFGGDEEIVFTLVVPKSVPEEMLTKYGFPRSGRLEFPMEEQDTRSVTTFRYVNRGREAKLLGDTVAKIMEDVSKALVGFTNKLGGEERQEGSVKAEKTTIMVEPSESAADELVVTISLTLIASGPDKNGRWQTKRMPHKTLYRAVPIDE